MGRVILDPKLVGKIADAKDKSEQYIKETVSKLAHKRGVSSEAALIYLAKQCGFGTALYLRKLDPDKQAQAREMLKSDSSVTTTPAPARAGRRVQKTVPLGKKSTLKLAAQNLIQDPALRARCIDLLTASASYDRAINQATQILEDRIRRKAAPPTHMTGEPLVGFAFKDKLSETILQVESGDADDQRGFTQILRGIVPAFRNKTHHHISEKFSQEDAMRVVGFIDVLLRIVDDSKKMIKADN